MEKTYRLRFTKLGPARFLSHIELSAALGRAIILSGISFVYSQGFHPHPKISFAGATAVGMESEGEFADIRIQDPGEKPGTLMARINTALPAGVAVTAMHELPPHAFSLAEMITGFEYDLILPDDFDKAEFERIEDAIRAFREAESFGVTRESKGKPVVKDIRPFVHALSLDRGSRTDTAFGPFRSRRNRPARRTSLRRPWHRSGDPPPHPDREDRGAPRRFCRRGRPGNFFPGSAINSIDRQHLLFAMVRSQKFFKREMTHVCSYQNRRKATPRLRRGRGRHREDQRRQGRRGRFRSGPDGREGRATSGSEDRLSKARR